MFDFLSALHLEDATVRMVLFGSLLIGATGGALGSFAVLRGRSLMGDALAHAALPGVALAFLWTGSKSLPVLITGATCTGIIGVVLIQFITSRTRIKADAAIGIVLTVFFGVGIVLLTHIQRSLVGNQAGRDKFLFGQAASMVEDDVRVMSVMSLFIFVVVLILYKEFKALIFDPNFLQSLGYSLQKVDLALMGLIVLTVMVGLQAVGVVLIAAMLITPAVAARFWTERLHVMVVLAAVIGGVSGATGTFLSAQAPRVPTGPVMVLVATGLFVVSALFAPRRGVLARWLRQRANALRERRHHLLRALIELEERAGKARPFSTQELVDELGWERRRVTREAKRLRRLDMVTLDHKGVEATPAGLAEGTFVVKCHRLWEHYLVYRDILAADHVDRPADEVEHLLTPDILERLEEILRRDHGIDTERVVDIHGSGSGYRPAGRERGEEVVG